MWTDASSKPRWGSVYWRWGVFFNRLGWEWDFKPDFWDEDNNYIPDFVLRFKKPLFVCVTPSTSRHDLLGWFDEDWQMYTGEVLVVGKFPMCERNDSVIGKLREWHPEYGPGGYGDCCLFRCLECGHWSLFHQDGSYHCRHSGCYDGNGHHGGHDGWEALWSPMAGHRIVSRAAPPSRA